LRQVLPVILLAGFLMAASSAGAEPASERYGEEYQACRDGNTHDIVMCLDKLVRRELRLA
jgi:hypothetical protein